MSDPRIFLKTGHKALHRPSCPNVRKLKNPTTAVTLSPSELWEPWRIGAWVARCCADYGWVQPIESYEWVKVSEPDYTDASKVEGTSFT